MSMRFWHIFGAVLMLSFHVVQAHADPVALHGSRTPAIAIDPVRDRGLVVYEYSGKIYGKFVDNAGRSVAGSEFLVFPINPASSSKYKDPAIVFKTPQNRFYIAARQSYPSTYNFPGGPVVFDTSDGIAVTAYDAVGTRLATRTLYTPGLLRNPLTVDAEARPVIVADNYNDPMCCVGVAWEDPRVPDRIHLIRLGMDLSLFDTMPRGITTPVAHVSGLSATYNSARDRFAFAYDGCNMAGRGCDAWVTALPAILNSGEQHQVLPAPTGSARVLALPAIAYVPGADRYAVAWYWNRPASTTMPALNGLATATVTTDFFGRLSTSTVRFPVQGGLICVFCNPAPSGQTQIVPLGGTSRVMIVAPSTRSGTQLFAGYVLDTALYGSIAARAFSSDAPFIGSGRAAYSPSGRVVGVWQQDTSAASVWAFGVAP